MANPLSGLFSDGGFVDRLGDQSNYLSTLGAGLLAHRQNANNPIMGDPRALTLAAAADQERQKAKQEEIAAQQSRNATVQFLMAQRGLDEGTAMQIVQGDPAILNSVLKGEETPETTAAIRDWEYANSLDPEQRKEFLGAKGSGGVNINLGGGAKLPAELGARLGLGDSFLRKVPDLERQIAEGKTSGLSGRASVATGWGEGGNIWRDVEDGQEALVRQMTGAGMSLNEAASYANRFGIKATDPKEVQLDKLRGLAEALQSAREGAVAGATGRYGAEVNEAPQGLDPADWEYMTPEERALFQ